MKRTHHYPTSLLHADKLRRAKKFEKTRRCNLCHNRFYASSPFKRFCKTCKTENEIYRFHELGEYSLSSAGNQAA